MIKERTLKLRIKKTPLFHRAAWLQPIPGYQNFYANEDGYIFKSFLADLSDLTQLPMTLTGGSENKRYLSVTCFGNKTCHRLTAATFLSKDGHKGNKIWNQQLCVDHKDNTTSNRIENLRMLTYSQNGINDHKAYGYEWRGGSNGAWWARINFKKIKTWWGPFDDEKKARAKYLKERDKLLA